MVAVHGRPEQLTPPRPHRELNCNDYSTHLATKGKETIVLFTLLSSLELIDVPFTTSSLQDNWHKVCAKLQIPLEMWSVRKLDRFEYAARRGCMNPNQSAIQYKAGIRINSSRPFCARPFVIHEGDSFAKEWKDQFFILISHFATNWCHI